MKNAWWRRAPVWYPDACTAAILLIGALLIWLPALWTPFWGDDYGNLHAARIANQAAESWRDTILPAMPLKFWRPLSQEVWWRLIESQLRGDVVLAHAALLLLHLLASVGVGVLGRTLARANGWSAPNVTGLLSAGFYCVLAVGLLPVHWVAAANSPILVMLTALLLSAWVRAASAAGGRRLLLLGLVPCLFVAALLSKESAILMPLLMLLLLSFCGLKLRRAELAVLLCCVGLGVTWLLLRWQLTVQADPAYAYAFGGNLLRNALSLVAWLCNVPREALRMLAVGPRLWGVAWALVVAALLLLAWVLALRGGVRRLSPRQWLLLMLFVLLAYGPYLPLAWNSYEYYAAVAAILPALVLARVVQGRGVAVPVALLMGLSGWLSVAGSRWIEHPGLIGRARWAEVSLNELAARPLPTPIWLQVADEQRFFALGVAGLAWRLGVRMDDIRPVQACPQRAGTCLRMDAEGRWSSNPSLAESY